MEPARSDETPGAVWPWTFPTGSRHIRVAGPTEALRRRTAGPTPPEPPVALPADPARPSSWQLAHEVWQESGVTWERQDPGAPAAGPPAAWDRDDPGRPDAAWHADDDPVEPAAAWYPDDDSVEPASLERVADGEWADDDRSEDVRLGDTWFTGVGPGDARVAAARTASPTRPEPITADSGLAAAPRRGGPEPAGRPGSGRTWQPPQPGSGWTEYPASGFPGQAWPAGPRAPLGAPVALDQETAESIDLTTPPRPDRPDGLAPGWLDGAALTEPDELFRAWQGSVNEAAGRGTWSVTRRAAAATRRRRALQAAAIGVPVAVIVTVGAGALMMLTGKANDMLAVRADTSTPSSAATATSSAAAGPSQGTGQGAGRVPAAFVNAALSGYPGQRGAVSVGAMLATTGVAVAVGAADGHPAIWRQGANGSWTLESAASLGGLTGSAGLTSVAHGPAGWIAVGAVADGATTEPVVFASADGVRWQPVTALSAQAGAGTEFLGAAASGAGYVVVGRQMVHGRTFAVLWYSADLRSWTADDNDGLDGRLQASTANAVAATAGGFIAVGSHGAAQAIWSSPDGRHWQLGAMSAPADATSATLRSVAASGTRVVAGGYAATRAGDIPVVVTTGGGGQWQQTVLQSPDGLGVVTALTATPDGFTAAGLVGQAGSQRAVIWTSASGQTWSRPVQAAGTDITALAVDGATVIDAAGQGTATTLTALPH